MLEHFEMVDGFNEVERDHLGPFVWCRGEFRLRATSVAGYALLNVCYPGTGGTLEIRRQDGRLISTAALEGDWQTVATRLDAAPGEVLVGRIHPVVPHPVDHRELGMMLRSIEPFANPARFELLSRAASNFALNRHEFDTGVVTPASFPPLLRITTEVRCNLPETGQACTYCYWDAAKRDERGAPAFSQTTLDELGDFYRCATEVVDCSIGEPTMKKEFPQIIGRISEDGKQMSLTTNGQLLVERRRKELLGKNLHLYVSIDSATAEGYRRYRNDRFEDIIDNLRALCRDKKAHHDLPRVFVSFLTMRSNVDELPQFLDLMKDVGVDVVKLRSLYVDDMGVPDRVMNNGYTFDYWYEALTIPELAALAPVAEQLARERDIVLYNETEQFPVQPGSTGAPLCSEPWRTMYALNRGISPCCYGQPMFRWSERGERTMSQFLRDCFDSPQMQELRAGLAAGQLPTYCQATMNCPIVKQVKFHEIERRDVRGVPAIAARQAATLPMVELDALRMSAPKQPLGADQARAA